MRIGRNVLLVLTLIVFNTSVFAQRNFSAEADEAYNKRQYFFALELYAKAYKKVDNKAEKARIIFKTAMCYQSMNNIKKSQQWFKKAIRAKYEDPITHYYYAVALKMAGEYDEAIISFQNYKEADSASAAIADAEIEACRIANSWVENATRYEVMNERQLNSKQNDFAPAYGDRKFKSLYITSDREDAEGKRSDGWTGMNFTDVFLVTKDRKGKWSTPTPIGEPVNTEYHDGSVCLDKKFRTMYFTRCEVAKKETLGCNIFVANKRGRAWDVPEIITLSTDTNKAIVYGHPSLSDDLLTLYFVSDMPGGQGGKDIWKITRPKKNKPWGTPENLGPVINTDKDEMFPYIHADGSLYFSSNGHMGMGGLDMFKAEAIEDGFGTPQNMKYPMNSSFDDFGIIFEGNSVEKGFFSSNRKGRGGDDIFSFVLPPLLFTLKGVVTDDSTKKSIPNAVVELKGTDGTVLYDTTDATGMYSFDNKQILQSTSYTLKASKPKSKEGEYLSVDRSIAEITTVGKEHSEDMVQDLALVEKPEEPIVLPDILYDLAKWDLKPQYQDSLNGLYKILVQNENIVIELSSHTDFRASLEYNDTLSFKRAKSVVDYLVKKGIAADRMKPRGYGERRPRLLKKDKVVILDGKPYTFKKGTELTEAYINSLKTNEEKEAAHQLNRRTEFEILSTDYVPSTDKNKKVAPVKIEIMKGDAEEEVEEQEEEESK